jgi:hypothetical protein
MLAEEYAGVGQTIQFHPNTTYENFVGGLAPLEESTGGNGNLGFRATSRRALPTNGWHTWIHVPEGA